MSHDNTVFVGLDVHKDSIVAACSVGLGEVSDLGKIGVLQRDMRKLCQRVQSKASHVVFVYEAGPCGYGLQRQLQRAGFTCHVCAPSLIPRKAGDRVKTDRRDAQKLVRALRADELSFVHVPDETDEALRDLVRAWNGARQDLRQAKQRLKSFLLVHGVRYEGNANWKEPHRRWLARFTFPQAWSQMALEEHRRAVEDRLAQSQRLEQLLRQEVVHWRLYPVIQALQALRGVQFTVAVGVIAETGDLSRFHNPRQLMDWLGLVPSEDSTGTRIRKGPITKAGNALARRLLIEAAWSYRYSARVSPIIQRRHEGLPKQITERAWEAQLRLCRRFRRLVARGKHRNSVVTAIARELSGFIWDIARKTPLSA
jgi:transposase